MQATIGVIGGTGPLGKGLALRLAKAGRPVVIGSRTTERGEQIAAWVRERTDAEFAGQVTGAANLAASEQAEIALVTIPYGGIDDTLPALAGALAGKVVVCCINQIAFDREGPYELQDGRPSSAEQCQLLLPESRVVAAFHHVAAGALLEDQAVDVDVLLSSDDEDAMEIASGIVRAVPGMRPVTVGQLRLAGPIEHFTAVLVALNKRHKVRAGIKLVGLVRD